VTTQLQLINILLLEKEENQKMEAAMSRQSDQREKTVWDGK
jgi:hypothetical protein